MTVAFLVILIGVGIFIASEMRSATEDTSPTYKAKVESKSGNISAEVNEKDTEPKQLDPTPGPKLSGLPYCNNEFEIHHEIASDHVKELDDDPMVADDEFVVWRDTAAGVGRCNNGNVQSSRFLFGYGEILTDEPGNPESFVGYLVVDGDSSEVSIFENCSEKQCEPTQWCKPIYGPSYCNEEGECTADLAFKGCQ